MKRVQPRAQGRAYRILKRTSHITIIVQEVEPKPRKPKKPTGGRAQAARAAKRTPVATTRPVPAEIEETRPVVPVAEAPEEVTPAPEVTQDPQSLEDTTQAPQAANVEDKTDEIGAPITPDADKA